eukprot:SAG31_NODE_658_length_13104_cov_4.409919_8_plen_102_part_00
MRIAPPQCRLSAVPAVVLGLLAMAPRRKSSVCASIDAPAPAPPVLGGSGVLVAASEQRGRRRGRAERRGRCANGQMAAGAMKDDSNLGQHLLRTSHSAWCP